MDVNNPRTIGSKEFDQIGSRGQEMSGVWTEKEVLRTGCVHDARELIAILADQPDFGVITQPDVELLLKDLAEFVDYFGEDPVFLY